MGRKAGQLRINVKKFGGLNKPCMKEMTSFLNCLSLNNNSDEKCARFKEQLNACMAAQVGSFVPFFDSASSEICFLIYF